MTVENDELEPWVRRNIGTDSELARADVVRIRDILLFMSQALQRGDGDARLRILEMWDTLQRPASSDGASEGES